MFWVVGYLEFLGKDIVFGYILVRFLGVNYYRIDLIKFSNLLNRIKRYMWKKEIYEEEEKVWGEGWSVNNENKIYICLRIEIINLIKIIN